MAAYNVTTSFEMTDGRELTCEWVLCVIEGNYYGLPENCYPDESEESDPVYYIDGDEIAYEDLPKGLAAIADKMYQCGQNEFGYTETRIEREEPNYEPDYY